MPLSSQQKIQKINTPLFLGLFKTKILKEKYQLRQSDVIALYWFTNFALSNQMKKIEIKSNMETINCYWVNYQTACVALNCTEQGLRKNFRNLCGINPDFQNTEMYEWPLFKVQQGSAHGMRVYFGFNKTVFEEIIELDKFKNMENIMSDAKLIEASPDTNKENKGAGIIFPELAKQLELWLSKRVPRTKEKIFTNRLPKTNAGKYTKQLIEVAEKLWAIYQGRFNTEYPIDPEFVKMNQNYITDETYLKIRAAKGNWDKVFNLVMCAIKNYRSWFNVECEPENKSWLPDNINNWLYNKYNGHSVFLACVNRGAYPVKEVMTDRIYNSLPDGVVELVEPILKEHWDQNNFWKRVKQVHDWYLENKHDLVQQQPNIGYWFDGGLEVWFTKYINWVSNLCGGDSGVHLKNIGVDNATWYAWISDAAKLHNFDL